jgi:hypothetical protein
MGRPVEKRVPFSSGMIMAVILKAENKKRGGAEETPEFLGFTRDVLWNPFPHVPPAAHPAILSVRFPHGMWCHQ